MVASLTASRDKIADAAAGHLATLAALATAAHEHNTALGRCRARLAGLGLAIGADVEQGALADGIVAGGITWTPVPADGLAASVLRQVFGGVTPRHPFNAVQEHAWLPSQLTQRPDGLRPPTLAAAGASVPEVPGLGGP